MIREANVDDFLEICDVCVEDLGYDCTPELVKSRLESLEKSREQVFVADVDGNAVGFVHAEKYYTLYYKSMVNIQGLAVAGKYRRNGYGKKLMQEVEKWAKEEGIDLIRLNSGIGRKNAHDFYRAIGFENEKEQMRFMKKIG